MTDKIISKWVLKYKDWDLIITSDKKVFDVKTKTQLVEYWNNGTIAYRLPCSTKRIGVKTINKYSIKSTIILQEFCPF